MTANTKYYQNAIRAHGRRMNAFAGEAVTYSRGTASVVVTAVHIPRPYSAQSDNGVLETADADDWIVMIDDLKLGTPAVAITPRLGDTITRTVAGVSEVYAVCFVPGRNVSDNHDSARARFTIHTQRKSTEAAPA